MKDYTSAVPVFSLSIKVVETTDPAHADNINAASEQLLQNTLSNRALIKGLFGFNYEGNGLLNNILGCVKDEETLIIPVGMGMVENSILVLTGDMPNIPAGGGDNSDYVLPVATTTSLGGVKIGECVNVKEDGTISVDLEGSAEKAASIVEANTEDFTDEEISDLLKMV